MHSKEWMTGVYSMLKGHYCAKEGYYVFAVWDHDRVKMAGAKLAQLEASTTPTTVSKYFTPDEKEKVNLTQELVCKSWNGDGIPTNTFSPNAYRLRNVIVKKQFCVVGNDNDPLSKIYYTDYE